MTPHLTKAAALALTVALPVATSLAMPAAAAEFRWASTTDPQTMDPHAVNSAAVLGFLNNVYEGLVRRTPDMKIEPALATSWEPIGDGEGWRFHLREGVTFHDGAPFTAEEVVFSYERAASPEADTSSWFASVTEVNAVDDLTVEVMTNAPNPIFPDSIANWMMMDSGWAESNGAERPAKDAQNHATLNANGTGAFRLAGRQPGLETVLEPFADWWDVADHNLTRATFTPIQNPATAVAALLSGDIDMIEPVPIQDAARLEQAPDVKVIRGIENRVMMLGFAQNAETLQFGDKGAPNPFRDVRVRQAVAHAVNVPAILQTIMRGYAEPSGQLITAVERGYVPALSERPAFDPDQSRALLTEAGYPDGFAFGLRCPNDRYLNDEAVCQAVVTMLAQVGLEAQLESMPVRNYWPELRAGNYDMFLLGWSSGTFDHEHPIRFLVATPDEDKKLGSWNFGGYSNARIDELLPQMQSEIDEAVRQDVIDEAAGIYRDEMAYVPLYVQPLLWGAREGVEVVQRPDNFFILRWVDMP